MDTDKDTDGDTDKNIEDAAVQSDKDDLEIIETSPDS